MSKARLLFSLGTIGLIELVNHINRTGFLLMLFSNKGLALAVSISLTFAIYFVFSFAVHKIGQISLLNSVLYYCVVFFATNMMIPIGRTLSDSKAGLELIDRYSSAEVLIYVVVIVLSFVTLLIPFWLGRRVACAL